MTDREKALERAAEIVANYEDLAGSVGEDVAAISKNTELYNISKQLLALHAELAALHEKTRWIPVDERLPGNERRVLVKYSHSDFPSHRLFTAFGKHVGGIWVLPVGEYYGDVNIISWFDPPESAES